MYQIAAESSNTKHKSGLDVIAGGYRYDKLVSHVTPCVLLCSWSCTRSCNARACGIYWLWCKLIENKTWIPEVNITTFMLVISSGHKYVYEWSLVVNTKMSVNGQNSSHSPGFAIESLCDEGLGCGICWGIWLSPLYWDLFCCKRHLSLKHIWLFAIK